jgi:hypothetical protein
MRLKGFHRFVTGLKVLVLTAFIIGTSPDGYPAIPRGGDDPLRSLSAPSVHLRLNQVGYRPHDPKVAIAATDGGLSGSFTVERVSDGAVVFTGTVGADQGAWGAFAHHYPLDFTALSTPGIYRLRLADGTHSPPFTIAERAYNGLADLSRRFFAVQRSGNTQPDGHAPSHLNDAPLSTDPSQHRDVTGGWYDAGDYLKFTLTTAYATLFQLLAYRDTPYAFQDFDPGGVPLILREARIGLNWLEKMWDPDAPMLYVQVGSAADHNQGWRLPEDDALDGTSQRPVYPAAPGKGANLAGRSLRSVQRLPCLPVRATGPLLRPGGGEGGDRGNPSAVGGGPVRRLQPER